MEGSIWNGPERRMFGGVVGEIVKLFISHTSLPFKTVLHLQLKHRLITRIYSKYVVLCQDDQRVR